MGRVDWQPSARSAGQRERKEGFCFLKRFSKAILSDNGVAATEFQFGKTKVFLKSPETLFFMEEQIEKFAFTCTTTIQNAWRNFKLRKKALEEAANAADLLRGRKQRNRDSVNRKVMKKTIKMVLFFMDMFVVFGRLHEVLGELRIAGGRETRRRSRRRFLFCRGFCGFLISATEMIFANAIEAFNRRLKTEKRDFVITNKALYFVSRKKKGTTILYKVTKRTELQHVTQISLSTFADDYIVIHCNDFDQVNGNKKSRRECFLIIVAKKKKGLFGSSQDGDCNQDSELRQGEQKRKGKSVVLKEKKKKSQGADGTRCAAAVSGGDQLQDQDGRHASAAVQRRQLSNSNRHKGKQTNK